MDEEKDGSPQTPDGAVNGDREEKAGRGFRATGRSFAATAESVVSYLDARGKLFGLETRSFIGGMIKLAILITGLLIALLVLYFAVVTFLAFLLYSVWPSFVGVFGVVAVAHVIIFLLLALQAYAAFNRLTRKSFRGTMAELKKDRQWLKQMKKPG